MNNVAYVETEIDGQVRRFPLPVDRVSKTSLKDAPRNSSALPSRTVPGAKSVEDQTVEQMERYFKGQ